MKKTILSVLIIPFIFSGCCSFAPIGSVLCDLASTFLAPVNPILATGVTFALKGIVKNIAEKDECNGNEKIISQSSPETNTGYAVQYRQNSGNNWENAEFEDETGNATLTVRRKTNSIDPDNDATINQNLLFEEEGEYRFVQNADIDNIANERDKSNNGIETTNQMTGKKEVVYDIPDNAPYAIILKVQGNGTSGKRERATGEKVKVKVLSYSITY